MTSHMSRYIPLEDSASGGFSDVHFYNDSILKRKVAIKYIKDESDSHRLKDEIDALMKLRSKHVVQIYDIVPTDSSSFGIVMEYIEGNDLISVPSESHSPDDILKILWQIASGIADIHKADVIHRDIKPNNMKIDAESIVKIFDFGLARSEGEKAKTAGFKGTFGFAAPEQFCWPEATFTSAVDTYAFGAIALYFATGNLPKVLTMCPPQPLPDGVFSSTMFNNYPLLIPLLEACFDHDAERRPSMVKMRDEIGKYLLVDKHQAITVFNGKPHILNSASRKASIKYEPIASCSLQYDGLEFKITDVQGEIFINNMFISETTVLQGACVIALGDQSRKGSRKFVTFDVSNPEVTL
ncbi:serine/threonine-protein kinase [Vibrio parahaemolyticus]|uniref:serine/threonine-protein kinase n=2 Tax=Vibrio TaxID=662 RepID=UPI00064A7554|nr:serine/threonine-protein kinase [Vibrio parahaemolyticus]